jgi:predicted nucleic acid-binding protein
MIVFWKRSVGTASEKLGARSQNELSMIGSVAFVYDLTLVTHNTADFQNIPGLRLDDWLTP